MPSCRSARDAQETADALGVEAELKSAGRNYVTEKPNRTEAAVSLALAAAALGLTLIAIASCPSDQCIDPLNGAYVCALEAR